MRHLPLLAGLALLTGCGTRAEPKPDPVAFTAAVTLPGGRPARDVTAVFVPDTAAQTAGRYRVTEKGELAPAPGGALTLIPGGYTVAVQGGVRDDPGEVPRGPAGGVQGDRGRRAAARHRPRLNGSGNGA
jgi:hypothetical protein